MKNRYRVAALVSACWLTSISAQAAAATIYTDRASFLAATTNQAVTTFNNISGTGNNVGPTFTGTDFTLSVPSGTLLLAFNNNSVSGYEFNSGTVLAITRLTQAVGTFTPGAGVTAFGFDFGVRASEAGSRVTINGVDYVGTGAPTLNFFGIVDSVALAPITLDFAGNRGILDNVTVAQVAQVIGPVTAAPEPATWMMMILGFGLAGSALRRRRRVSLSYA